MAELVGKDGKASIDDVEVDLTSWACTLTNDLGETTNVGDSYKTFKPTMRSGSGNVVFILDPTIAKQKTLIEQLKTGVADKLIDLKLESDDTNDKMLHFSAWVSSVDLPVTANGVDQATVNFTMDGPLYSTPTSA